MEKKIIFAISDYNKKYYFDPITKTLPLSIKKEVKEIGYNIVNKVSGIFSIGIYENFEIFLNHEVSENELDYDLIGIRLEIERLKKEKKSLFDSICLWYKVLEII